MSERINCGSQQLENNGMECYICDLPEGHCGFHRQRDQAGTLRVWADEEREEPKPTPLEKAWKNYTYSLVDISPFDSAKHHYRVGWQARGKVDKRTVEKSWIGWDGTGQIKHTQEAIDKNND